MRASDASTAAALRTALGARWWAWVRWATVSVMTAGLSGCFLTAWFGTERAPAPAAPPPPPAVAYVHPDGDDRDPGTAEAPFKTVARALAEHKPTVEIHPGRYEMGRIFVTRAVRLVGTSTGVELSGGLFVSTDDVDIENLAIDGDFEVAHADGVSLVDVTVRPTGKDDTISLVGSSGRLERVYAVCAPETCIQITTSTVSMTDVHLEPDSSTKRGLRVSSSSVTATGLTIRGTRVSQVQAELRSSLDLKRADLRDGGGSAVVAVLDSRIALDDVTTASTAQSGILAQTSTVVAADSRFGPALGQTVSISGAYVRLTDCRVSAGRYGAINLSRFEERSGRLELIGGVVAHGDRDGILADGSVVEASGTRFEGRWGIGQGHAISLRGPHAKIDIRNVVISSPAGFGLEFANDASGTFTGTVTQPGIGGVRVEEALGDPIVLDRLVVENCRSGSAVDVLEGVDVRIENSRLTGCPEAGVLAARRANVSVTRSVVNGHTRYALAAFGDARVSVESSTVAGDTWATFSACSDESEVIDAGGNRFEGRRGDCL